MTILTDLRRDLVHARDVLRTAKADLETIKTLTTMDTKGTNAEERKKADAQALAGSVSYNSALRHMYACEHEIDRLEAEIDIAKDERTARELACREENNRVLDKYADALLRMARQNPVVAAIDATLPL